MNVSCSLRGPGFRWKKLSTKINDGSNYKINAYWCKAIKGFQSLKLSNNDVSTSLYVCQMTNPNWNIIWDPDKG